MATIVSFHAHPDDEAIGTGGTLARAAAEGHRTVLVFGTGGELGEVADGVLADGESLAQRRRSEVEAAAEILGVARVVFLGYRDSGMAGEASNDHPSCFWRADVDEAAKQLAQVLVEESAAVLTIYDDHGGYGHPDHIQVHRVGVLAAEKAGTPHVLEMTMNRDHIRELMVAAAEAGEAPDGPDLDEEPDFGSPASVITTAVDVSDYVDTKRAAMAAHASQIPADSWFLMLPDDQFVAAFGHEWYIRRGDVVPEDTWLLPGGA